MSTVPPVSGALMRTVPISAASISTRKVTMPSRSSWPSCSSAPATFWRCTNVPLGLPWSTTVQPSPRCSITACLRETDLSSTTTSQVASRPTSVRSRVNSSSVPVSPMRRKLAMLSLHREEVAVESLPGPHHVVGLGGVLGFPDVVEGVEHHHPRPVTVLLLGAEREDVGLPLVQDLGAPSRAARAVEDRELLAVVIDGRDPGNGQGVGALVANLELVVLEDLVGFLEHRVAALEGLDFAFQRGGLHRQRPPVPTGGEIGRASCRER